MTKLPLADHGTDYRTALSSAVAISARTPDREAIILRKRLKLPDVAVRSAVVFATAHGIYELTVDGVSPDGGLLRPGWTSYEWRLQVQEIDVTHLVRPSSIVEIHLGNGWWRGGFTWPGAAGEYGDEISFIATIRIEFVDGSTLEIPTDPSWTAWQSDTLENSLYNGQSIDARLRTSPQQLELTTATIDPSTLVPTFGPPTVRHESIAPVKTWPLDDGRQMLDFGQNVAGWISLHARGQRGGRITVRHAEVLEEGELAVRPLRTARATDVYTLSGAEDIFEPTFTFHGFRYAEVDTSEAPLAEWRAEAVVIHTGFASSGSFECSHDLVNQLALNSVWSQRGNSIDIPSDCPQRDERLGWTGDIAVFAPTACRQFDVADFLHKWLLDLRAETLHSREQIVPDVVPDLLRVISAENFPAEPRLPKAIWGDAAVWVPMALWDAYGDFDRLRVHYETMRTHMESVERVLSPQGLWNVGFQFGDWLDPDSPPEDAAAAKADPHVVATACLVRTADMCARAADVLSLPDDAARWRNVARRGRRAFRITYCEDDGTIRSDCATVYALAIHFDVVQGELRRLAGDRLATLVTNAAFRTTTGFAGTPYVLWALSDTGHASEAYRLLLETQCPSWLYPITMGATTIWERWDSMLPDGSINPGSMTSFNHFALGAVTDWLYGRVAGIVPEEPGYSRVRFVPTPGPGLDWARAHISTRHGRVESGWFIAGDSYIFEVLVPAGTIGELVLPDGTREELEPGRHVRQCLRDPDSFTSAPHSMTRETRRPL